MCFELEMNTPHKKEKHTLKHFAFSATDITRCKVGDTECIVETSNKVLNMFSTGKMNLFVFFLQL